MPAHDDAGVPMRPVRAAVGIIVDGVVVDDGLHVVGDTPHHGAGVARDDRILR